MDFHVEFYSLIEFRSQGEMIIISNDYYPMQSSTPIRELCHRIASSIRFVERATNSKGRIKKMTITGSSIDLTAYISHLMGLYWDYKDDLKSVHQMTVPVTHIPHFAYEHAAKI